MRLSRSKPRWWLGGVLLVVSLYAASPALRSTRNALITSDSFILYSLEPQWEAARKGARFDRPTFYGNPIMGQTTIDDPQLRAQLVDSVYRSGEFAFACFNPHYGIRARKGWRTIDVVICFDCSQVMFHQYGKDSFIISRDDGTARALYDRTLQQVGVAQNKSPLTH